MGLQPEVSAARAPQAIWDEMRFFDHIMEDHGRLIRGMLNLHEDATIREADRFAALFGGLEERTRQVPPGAAEQVTALVTETVPPLQRLIQFKQEVARLLEDCRIQAIFPAHLIEHIRHEAVWYLGMLARTLGQPTPCRQELMLPGDNTRAILLPRHLIGRVPANLNEVSLEYDLFWVHIHQEHAGFAGTHTRPEGQKRIHRLLMGWERDFERLLERGKRLFADLGRDDRLRRPALDPAVAHYNREVTGLMSRWRTHLIDLGEELRRCAVPSGQTNFWPDLTIHLRLETEYLLDALQRIAASLHMMEQPGGSQACRAQGGLNDG